MLSNLLSRHLLAPLLVSLVLGSIVAFSFDPSSRLLSRWFADEKILLASASEMEALLQSLDSRYIIPKATKLNRPLLARNLPADLSRVPQEVRKELFMAILMPHIEQANMSLIEERTKLLTLISKSEKFVRLTFHEKRWLRKLAQKYRLETTDFHELKKRVDIIPPSLALAQAILETGWGTSRFAVEGNALFGIHSPESGSGTSLKARKRAVSVASYKSLAASVQAYFLMLNSASPYRSFRTLRFQLKENGINPNGSLLADSLLSYSELEDEYVRRVKTIINDHHLTSLDDLKPEKYYAPLLVTFRRES